ncbi:HAD-IA family hydrolase [Leucothrix pacifica]|uniref:HAD family hydrolase n=1 Tax=Leucothrix pacifica TaxID=1247513 RepID=A0A317CLL8_9GAMM|nr:HAD-IA family hydrolase [Leucothrix pacifica]PWQ97180.1 HAD family hydrolase [Leucothrix pacifica]
MSQTTIKAVLFDMDGLLLETESIYTEVTQMIVGRYGKVFDWSVKSHMIGRDSLDAATYLVKALELPFTPEFYLEERNELLNERFAFAQPKPGAPELIRKLADMNVPIAVATSSKKYQFEIKTSKHQDWFSLFDTIVTSDHEDVKHAKPAPDIFLTAAAQLGVAAEHCLVFEDAPSGVAATNAAGMSVIAVPDPNMSHDQFTDANEVLDSLAEFDFDKWGLK